MVSEKLITVMNEELLDIYDDLSVVRARYEDDKAVLRALSSIINLLRKQFGKLTEKQIDVYNYLMMGDEIRINRRRSLGFNVYGGYCKWAYTEQYDYPQDEFYEFEDFLKFYEAYEDVFEEWSDNGLPKN